MVSHLHEIPHQRKTIGRLLVSFLLGCSAILLFRSFKLESFRFQALVQNSVSRSRSLPSEGEMIISGSVGKKWNTEFYVPSLDYRIKGKSQYSSAIPNAADFEAHIYCEEFERELSWDWWRPNEEHTKARRNLRTSDTKSPSPKRLLIGLFAGYDSSAYFLERSAYSARVYAEALFQRGVDVTVVTLQGTAFAPHGCKAPMSHSSIDKIRILFEAIDAEESYDRLLLLDPDVMVVDTDQDLFSLWHDVESSFVVQGPVLLDEDGKKDKYSPWRIASEMTMWNLNHSATRTVALDWFHYAKNAIIRGSYQSDQKYLHKALQRHYKTNQNGMVARNEDRRGIVMQMNEESTEHLIQKFKSTGREKNLEASLEKMDSTLQQVCDRTPTTCDRVGSGLRYDAM